MTITANFAVGVNGNQVKTTDVGSQNPWDFVVLANVPLYSTAHPAFGALGARVFPSAALSYMSWKNGGQFPTTTDHYGRLYVYVASLPDTNTELIRFSTSASEGDAAGSIWLLTTGVLNVDDGPLANAAASTTALAAGNMYRLEWHAVHATGTSGTITVRIYTSATSSTIAETVTLANRNTGASCSNVAFGVQRQAATADMYFDQIAELGTDWVGPAPVSTTAPAVSGSAPQGSTLSCDGGTWNGGQTFTLTYQWTRDGANISGATSSTYVTQAADVGHAVGCNVTATGQQATNDVATQGSGNTVTVTAGSSPANTVAPAVTGTTTVGQTLTTDNGTWTGSPTSYAYQWQRDSFGAGSYSNIGGATATTYVLVNADDDCHVRCVVTATNVSGSGTANSNAVGPVVEPAPTNSVAPAVSGSVAVGSTLSVTTGTWTNTGGHTVTYAYQWKRDGSNIGGATSSTYTSQVADVTHAVSCTVTATNSGGSASQASSNSITVTQGPTNSVAPAVTGTATVGQTLTTTDGTWTGTAPVAFSYQWQRDVFGAGSYSDISSATSSTHVLVDADDACHVRCVVTGTNVDGATAANSNAAGPVVEPAPTNSVAPVVSGSTAQGATLSVTTGTWTNTGGHTVAYTYQWKRDGSNITGATASSYATQSADVGHAIRCTVTATNSGGAASQASSNAITVAGASYRGYGFQ